MDRAAANHLIAQPKRYRGPLAFHTKDTNSHFRVIAFRVEGEDGATIPGLTVEFQLRIGISVDRCKYSFTLFYLQRRKKERIYQIEVVPPSKRSHNNRHGPPIYGPHEHILEEASPIQTDLGCSDYEAWLTRFCQRTCLTLDQAPPPPFGPDHGLQLAEH